MAAKSFDLGDYVEVKDRIAILYELYPQARLVTGEVRLTTEPDGKPRVMVQGLAYRTPDDPQPGVGWSWMELPGTTSYTKGSEIENTETSAWGRAIASLGILVDRSIASAQEVANKQQGAADAKPLDASGETMTSLGVHVRVGAVAKGSGRHSSLESRETPDGHHLGFRLELGDGKVLPQVVVEGPLATALLTYYGMDPDKLFGLPVTVEGEVFEVKAEKRRAVHRMYVARIETPDVTLPAPVTEAESVPLFDDADQANIDAALASA
jgi:hypothetical protein